MRLPPGDIVAGSFVRDVEVRPREIQLSLTADKAKYTVGEPMILTGIVKNISNKDHFTDEFRMPEVVLREIGTQCEFRLSSETSLGKSLTPGSEQQLFQVRCKAGEADKRFVADAMRELVAPPFGRVGQYTLECRMRIETETEVPENELKKVWLRNWMEALSPPITVEIIDH